MNLFKNDAEWASHIDPRIALSPAQFCAIYASHYATALYFAIAVVTGAAGLMLMQSWWQVLGSLAIVVVIYPFVEFGLHRFVLHNRALYRKPMTARLWRRIHYDHHMQPNDLSVLFGAVYTTIPVVLVATLPLGYLAYGVPGAVMTASGGFFALMAYEFFHSAAHLPVTFKSAMMQRMRRHHLLHHFHAEDGNYGIVTDVLDRTIGTAYALPREKSASATVKNLGYTSEEAQKYPWVAALDHKTQRS